MPQDSIMKESRKIQNDELLKVFRAELQKLKDSDSNHNKNVYKMAEDIAINLIEGKLR